MGRLGERITSSEFDSPRTLGPRVKLPTGRFRNWITTRGKTGPKPPGGSFQPPPSFINQGVKIDAQQPVSMADKASKVIEKITPK
jgi:hypothetical protein